MIILDKLSGGLVVSCQARPGEPLATAEFMAALATSVANAGAVGIRANGVDHVQAIRSAVTIPLIGLWKDGTTGVYITPTARHAEQVAVAGADIVAVDGTRRPRPDGRSFADTVRALHAMGTLVMADIASVDDARAAQDAGADMVSTTLSGYTAESSTIDGPDLDLVALLATELEIPVFAEGRITSPEQARVALDAGAHAVVVGTAITAPQWITQQYITAMSANGHMTC